MAADLPDLSTQNLCCECGTRHDKKDSVQTIGVSLFLFPLCRTCFDAKKTDYKVSCRFCDVYMRCDHVGFIVDIFDDARWACMRCVHEAVPGVTPSASPMLIMISKIIETYIYKPTTMTPDQFAMINGFVGDMILYFERKRKIESDPNLLKAYNTIKGSLATTPSDDMSLVLRMTPEHVDAIVTGTGLTALDRFNIVLGASSVLDDINDGDY